MESKTVVSAAAKRGKKMLLGGLTLAHAAGICAAGLALAVGRSGAVWAVLIGFGLVVAFFTVGQLVELSAVELASVPGLVMTLGSYVVRVLLLGVALNLVLASGRETLSPTWLFVGVVSSVLGWVIGIVVVAARQRVAVFDHDYQPPSDWDRGQ